MTDIAKPTIARPKIDSEIESPKSRFPAAEAESLFTAVNLVIDKANAIKLNSLSSTSGRVITNADNNSIITIGSASEVQVNETNITDVIFSCVVTSAVVGASVEFTGSDVHWEDDGASLNDDNAIVFTEIGMSVHIFKDVNRVFCWRVSYANPQNQIDIYTRKFVDENGLTSMEVPLNKPIYLRGIKSGYDAVNDEYYLESILAEPYLSSVSPSFMTPSETRVFELVGSGFTNNTTITSTNTDIIINYVNYYIDEIGIARLTVSITSNTNTGSIDFIINNGKYAVFSNVIQIVVGVVYEPTINDWTLTQPIKAVVSGLELTIYNTRGYGVWDKIIDTSEDFSIDIVYARSNLGKPNDNHNMPTIKLMDIVTGLRVLDLSVYDNAYHYKATIHNSSGDIVGSNIIPNTYYDPNITGDWGNAWDSIEDIVFRIIFRKNDKLTMTVNNVVFSQINFLEFDNNLQLRAELQTQNIKSIKYIVLPPTT